MGSILSLHYLVLISNSPSLHCGNLEELELELIGLGTQSNLSGATGYCLIVGVRDQNMTVILKPDFSAEETTATLLGLFQIITTFQHREYTMANCTYKALSKRHVKMERKTFN